MRIPCFVAINAYKKLIFATAAAIWCMSASMPNVYPAVLVHQRCTRCFSLQHMLLASPSVVVPASFLSLFHLVSVAAQPLEHIV
jgi:ABC-type Fe3+ transport system permease subunit